MSEQFLTLMADLDEESQNLMAGWYEELQTAGFTSAPSGRPARSPHLNFKKNDLQ